MDSILYVYALIIGLGYLVVLECKALIDCVGFQTLTRPKVLPADSVSDSPQNVYQYVVHGHGLSLSCHSDKHGKVKVGWQLWSEEDWLPLSTFNDNQPYQKLATVNSANNTLQFRGGEYSNSYSFPYDLVVLAYSTYYRCYTLNSSLDLQLSYPVKIIIPYIDFSHGRIRESKECCYQCFSRGIPQSLRHHLHWNVSSEERGEYLCAAGRQRTVLKCTFNNSIGLFKDRGNKVIGTKAVRESCLKLNASQCTNHCDSHNSAPKIESEPFKFCSAEMFTRTYLDAYDIVEQIAWSKPALQNSVNGSVFVTGIRWSTQKDRGVVYSVNLCSLVTDKLYCVWQNLDLNTPVTTAPKTEPIREASTTTGILPSTTPETTIRQQRSTTTLVRQTQPYRSTTTTQQTRPPVSEGDFDYDDSKPKVRFPVGIIPIGVLLGLLFALAVFGVCWHNKLRKTRPLPSSQDS